MNEYVPYLKGAICGFLAASALARIVLWPYVRKITADKIADRINEARYGLWWAGTINRGENNALVAVQGSIWRHDDENAMSERIRGNLSYLNSVERSRYADQLMARSGDF